MKHALMGLGLALSFQEAGIGKKLDAHQATATRTIYPGVRRVFRAKAEDVGNVLNRGKYAKGTKLQMMKDEDEDEDEDDDEAPAATITRKRSGLSINGQYWEDMPVLKKLYIVIVFSAVLWVFLSSKGGDKDKDEYESCKKDMRREQRAVDVRAKSSQISPLDRDGICHLRS